MRFGVVFITLQFILNTFSIFINGVNHWIDSSVGLVQGIINLIFAVTTGLYSETPFDWNYFQESLTHFGSALQVQIVAIILSVIIYLIAERASYN